MSVSPDVILYILFVAAVGIGRLLEMRISRRNQHSLLRNGSQRIAEPYFHLMVGLHTGVLIASVVEVLIFGRPFIPALGVPTIALFIACSALRLWVIRTLAGHWNVQVVNSLELGIVTAGPYRYIRHPNYTAVFLELIAIPLIHTAIFTALIGSVAHVWVLYQRIRVEDRMLLANAAYRQAMGTKPRFIPALLRIDQDVHQQR